MPYNPKYNEQSYEYRKNHLKRVGIDFNLNYYNDVLIPEVSKSGLTVSGYIKKAIEEKMKREGAFVPQNLPEIERVPAENIP